MFCHHYDWENYLSATDSAQKSYLQGNPYLLDWSNSLKTILYDVTTISSILTFKSDNVKYLGLIKYSNFENNFHTKPASKKHYAIHVNYLSILVVKDDYLNITVKCNFYKLSASHLNKLYVFTFSVYSECSTFL